MYRLELQRYQYDYHVPRNLQHSTDQSTDHPVWIGAQITVYHTTLAASPEQSFTDYCLAHAACRQVQLYIMHTR